MLKQYRIFSKLIYALTICFSVELYDFGIICGIFEPGVFKTNLLNKEAKNKRVNFVWNKMSQELRDEYGEAYKEKCKT